MGLLSGSSSFVRYTVEGQLPENFWNFAAERLAAFSFRDIDDSFEEFSIGWVSMLNMFNSPVDDGSFQAADSLVVALRIDERRLSPAVLNKFCRKEEERLKKERQIPRLARSHRLEIKENMRLQLIKKAAPMATVCDLCWNLADNTLLFFSTNQKIQALLEDFFKESFDLRLVLQVPYTTAAHLLAPDQEDSLARLTPAIFV